MYDSVLAEESVAGCILTAGNEVFPTVRGIVKAGDFSVASARAVYMAAVDLDDNRLPIDPVTLMDKAAAMGTPLSREWVKSMIAQSVTTANVAVNAEIVHNAAIRREAMDVCKGCAEDEIDPAVAYERLGMILAGGTSAIPTPVEDAISFHDGTCKASKGELRTTLSTGFRSLDQVLGGGLAIGGISIVGARTSVGKSLFGLAVAENSARSGIRVLYFSLEMTRRQLWARRVADAIGISSDRILNGDLPNEESWQRFNIACSDLSDRPFLIWDKPCRIEDIELKSRAAGELGLIVIDYLNNITPERGEESSFYVSVSNSCRRLQALASSLDTPILTLCQMNRSADTRDNKRPRLSDMRDSGKIEEVADAVMLLNRPEDRASWEHQILEVDVAKNRHGMIGMVSLDVVLSTSSVRDEFQQTDERTPFDGEDT